jgi:hypothetical protein
LGTGRHNLSRDVEQKQLVQNSSLSPFVFLERKKRQDGLIAETKRLVTLCWTTKTQVGHHKKDVTQKHIRAHQYEVHATHYLLETQVSFTLGFQASSKFCNDKDLVYNVAFRFVLIMHHLGKLYFRFLGTHQRFIS